MGCPVEIEFAVNLHEDKNPEFSLLQIRPMMVAQHHMNVDIKEFETEQTFAFCHSNKAMGSSQISPLCHIIYVKPDAFDTARTVEIAAEIEQLNTQFGLHEKRRCQLCRLESEDSRPVKEDKYLLIGPGRWGTTDRFLGIPVKWNQITHVGTIIETVSEKLSADPSQGSHFFHNITSLGINYLGVPAKNKNFIDWAWLDAQPAHTETHYLRYLQLPKPAILKIDGRTSMAVILKEEIQMVNQCPD